MVSCIRCPRVYHTRCLAAPSNAAQASNVTGTPNASVPAPSEQVLETAPTPTSIVCVECERMEEAHRLAITCPAMRDIPPERFSKLLLYVVDYLKDQAVSNYLVAVST